MREIKETQEKIYDLGLEKREKDSLVIGTFDGNQDTENYITTNNTGGE